MTHKVTRRVFGVPQGPAQLLLGEGALRYVSPSPKAILTLLQARAWLMPLLFFRHHEEADGQVGGAGGDEADLEFISHVPGAAGNVATFRTVSKPVLSQLVIGAVHPEEAGMGAYLEGTHVDAALGVDI